MMALMEGMAAIIVGSVFGGVFVIACFISSIKAVRDRRRTKRKQAAKAKQLIETEEGTATETRTLPLSSVSNSFSNTGSSTTPAIRDVTTLKTQNKGMCDGFYNVSFTPSNGDIKSTCEERNKMSTCQANNKNNSFKTRTLSGEIYRCNRDIVANHMPPECLAIRKIPRRHSYEVAVAENSWMPMEMPSFATSEVILNTYNYGVSNNKPRSTSERGFENRAYDAGVIQK